MRWKTERTWSHFLVSFVELGADRRGVTICYIVFTWITQPVTARTITDVQKLNAMRSVNVR